MIRFILKREFKLHAFRQETFETIDVDLPELESELLSGGRGGQGHSITRLVGFEIIESEIPGEKSNEI